MIIKNLILIATALCLFTSPLLSQETYYTKDFKMSVAGTSTLHDWESSVTKVNASATIDMESSKLQAIKSLNVTIPVKSIESPKGRIMDNKTYDALKSDKYPNITFRLSKASISGAETGKPKVSATGRLTIAGTTKTVNLYATGKTDSSGNITFTGSKSLKMTDYNMDPPTALMGTIKTGDEVTVSYQLTLASKGNSASTK